MMTSEHSVEDFIEARLLSDVTSRNEGTLARLVERFRKEPPQPRQERSVKNPSEEFWWLHSTPSHESTSLSDNRSYSSIDSSTTPKKKQLRNVTNHPSSTSDDTHNAIDFRANRLLELTDSTISTSDSPNETTGEMTSYQTISWKSKYGSDQTSTHSKKKHQDKINNPWSCNPSLNTQTDILQQWRLARKMEMARMTSEPNVFLENIPQYPNSDKQKLGTKSTAEKQVSEIIIDNRPYSGSARLNKIEKDYETAESLKPVHDNNSSDLTDNLRQLAVNSHPPSKVNGEQVSHNEYMNTHDCRASQPCTTDSPLCKCLFCFNNQLPYQTPCGYDIYKRQHACSVVPIVPSHAHKICDILPCEDSMQNCCVSRCNKTIRKSSCRNAAEENMPVIAGQTTNSQVPEKMLPEEPKRKYVVGFKDRSDLAHRKVVHDDDSSDSNCSEKKDTILNPLLEQVVSSHVFNQSQPVKNQVSIEKPAKQKGDVSYPDDTVNNSIVLNACGKSPGEEFNDDELLEDLRRRRDLLQERLTRIDQLLAEK